MTFFSHVHCFVVVVSLTLSKTLTSRTSLSEAMIKEMEEMRKDNETLRSMVKVYQVMELRAVICLGKPGVNFIKLFHVAIVFRLLKQ